MGWGCHLFQAHFGSKSQSTYANIEDDLPSVSNNTKYHTVVEALMSIPTKWEPPTFAAKGTSSSAVSGQLYRSSNLLAKVKRHSKGNETHMGPLIKGKHLKQIKPLYRQIFLSKLFLPASTATTFILCQVTRWSKFIHIHIHTIYLQYRSI